MTELTSLQLLFLVSDYVVVALALGIAYVASTGARRNDSRPMAFIAAGFVLTFGVPGGIFLLGQVLPISTAVVGIITQTGEVAGMLSILYGFVAPARSSGTG